MDKVLIKDLEYYLSLRYQIILTPEEDGWGATIPDLPGVAGGGDTIAEALDMLEDAKQGWLSVRLERGNHIPEPSN